MNDKAHQPAVRGLQHREENTFLAPSRKPITEIEPTLAYSPARRLLEELLRSSVINRCDWEALPQPTTQEIAELSDTSALLARLVGLKLLTEYQAGRVSLGRAAELTLGNYRVLDHLGQGGTSEVFLGEHLLLRRPVAIKVFRLSPGENSGFLRRAYTEMWALGQLQHPNIVAAFDAGEAPSTNPGEPQRHYLVMEYVTGRDLEALVQADGPLAPAVACAVASQIAAGLAEAHEHGLVHRDVKPSNVILTPHGQAKLLDFGLSRSFRHRQTEPGALMGTVGFMAPEQAEDASAVDIRADLYGLGGVLFWCLTGQPPFPPQHGPFEDLARRRSLPPPRARQFRPDLPPRLDEILARLLAPCRDNRYADPQAALRLAPFSASLPGASFIPASASAESNDTEMPIRLALVIDDDAHIRGLCQLILGAAGVVSDEASGGAEGLEAVQQRRYDLLLLDVDMPDLNGPDVLRRLRANPPYPNLKVIMMSGRASGDEMSALLAAGADDYLAKPFSSVQLTHRVQAALRLKAAQDRSELLVRHLYTVNLDLEHALQGRDCDLVHARNALVLAMAELVGHRDMETGAHLLRLQGYCRCLAEEALIAGFAGQVNAGFIELLECCAPLHDIGKAGIPDHILLKPGPLTAEERAIMQTHTVIGAETLYKIARKHGFAQPFFQMAVEVTRHHHERWDGTGYPDRLAGDSIPMAARFVALADVYDALRSRRVYKPGLSHDATMRIMVEESPGHFDPALLLVFQRCAARLDQVYLRVAE